MKYHEIPRDWDRSPFAERLSTDVEEILKYDYASDKVLEDKTIEQIRDEYSFDEIKDAFSKRQIPRQLEFFLSGENDNFVHACNFLLLSKDNSESISFLCSDIGKT